MPKKQFWQQKSFITWLLFAFVSILITLREVFGSNDPVDSFKTFVYAHHHLLAYQDLYAKYPQQYHTLYNYSPFFALFMGIFAYFPIWFGAILWNLTHTFAFWFAIKNLPLQGKNDKTGNNETENNESQQIENQQQNFILWFCLVELTTALMNVQTNPSIVAILVFTFICFEKNQIFWASFWVIFGLYFKIYGVIGGALFVFYPQKIKFIVYCIFWGVVFLLLPLLFISLEQLILQHQSWLVQLQSHSQRDSMTVMGVLDIWIGRFFSHKIIILLGILATVGICIRLNYYKNLQFKLQFLASLLIFVVIFNPGSESPTYIIAVTGVALWYVLGMDKFNKNAYLFSTNFLTSFLTIRWQKMVLILVFLFTCLAPTDIYPPSVRKIFEQFCIKAIPCILVWCIVIFELYFKDFSQEITKDNDKISNNLQ